MGISALPDTTVRAIGATQVLTDPAALVKELVDNALDAHATSISVEIHHNTLDIIQVRDNGHGIAPEDRPLLAKRYCTSKLSNYDDLKDIGGSSLGFRGEALASAAELSGSLTISTRVEGEQVGAALKINQKGEVIGQDRASLPVGTCVKITDFVKANPVRKQVVLKNADACLKKIKRCLQAYAFARPRVRYSLRVLKAKTAKGDWVYAPKPNGNAEDAAIKLVGSACASQCSWSVLEHEGYSFQAFLLRPDAESSKIGGHGLFISIDARPVSSVRGHFKQIGKVYREALKGAGPQLEDVKEPFLYLEISCPDEAYDINVEPAKDDVAFEDASKVIEGMRKLFSAVYAPEQAPPMDESPAEEIGHPGQVVDERLHEPVMLKESEDMDVRAQGLPANAMSIFFNHPDDRSTKEQLLPSFEDTPTDQATSHARRKVRNNMYGCDEEDLYLLDAEPPEDRSLANLEELRQANKDVTVSNPWVLAKFNSSTRPTQVEQLPETHDSEANVLSSPPKRNRPILDDEEAMLPTPRPSSPSPPVQNFQTWNAVPDLQLARNGNFVGQARLPAPQMYSPMPSSDVPAPGDLRMRPEDRRPAYNYGLSPQAADFPAGTPLDAITDLSVRPRRSPRKQDQPSRVNKPFVSPLKDQPPRERVWFDHLEGIERRPRPGPRTQNNDHGMVTQGELGDLTEDGRPLTPPRRNRDIRDFVGGRNADSISSLIESRNYPRGPNRDQNADQENQIEELDLSHDEPSSRPPGFVRASDVACMNEEYSSPEKQSAAPRKRRKTSERPALQDLSTNTPRAQEAEEDQEYRPATSRALSCRRSSHKVGRTKSSRLPLERTPAGQGTQNLVLPTTVSTRGISQLAGKIDEERSLIDYDAPAIDLADVFISNPPDLQTLTNDLHDLLLQAGGDSDIPRPDHLFRELQSAFNRHSTSNDRDEVMSSI